MNITSKLLSAKQGSGVSNEMAHPAIKVAFIGDSGVGKTAILCQLINSDFRDEGSATVGVDFFTRTIKHQGHNVKINVWDTAGQERFSKIISSYYRGVHAYVLVFALDDETSLKHISNWFDKIYMYNPQANELFYLIVGNKSDIKGQMDAKIIDKELYRLKIAHGNVSYIQTSAKNKCNLEMIFEQIVQHCFKPVEASVPIAISPPPVNMICPCEPMGKIEI